MKVWFQCEALERLRMPIRIDQIVRTCAFHDMVESILKRNTCIIWPEYFLSNIVLRSCTFCNCTDVKNALNCMNVKEAFHCMDMKKTINCLVVIKARGLCADALIVI